MFDERREAQARAAASRVAERAPERAEHVGALATSDGVGQVNPPERIARRLDRLTRYYADEPTPTTAAGVPTAAPEIVLAAARERSLAPRAPKAVREAVESVGDSPGVVLERIINTADFVDIRFLEAGVAAARAVGRVDIRDQAGKIVGYGTGSLVSPRLLLTNHHVLPEVDVARVSSIEFDFQDGLDGQPLCPQVIPLDPGAFFLADQERDFALVAVGASEDVLRPFGRNPLIEAEGKAVIGEFVTIVQHPRGQKKQVSLRDNRLVDFLEDFLHYEADTEPGSSGSPVFNDQWEVVALHHAGVPAPEHAELGGYINEGIRVSRIMQFLRSQPLDAPAQALADQLVSSPRVVVSQPSPAESGPAPGPASESGHRDPISLQAAPTPGTVHLTIPIELALTLGTPGAATLPAGQVAASTAGAEAVRIDPDYQDRRGYAADFLGSSSLQVPLPSLSAPMLAQAAINSAAVAEPRHVLPYHRYSVVLNQARGLAFFTAVNIDGALSQRIKREADRWFLDPRVPTGAQTGEAVYADNDLDRGHLVRRLDPAWGATATEAKSANDDTFHFTNCTPQHKDFNENKTTWAGLEDYILENADNRDFKVSVITGPVLADDDDEYRGVQLPRQFWKVVAMIKANGQLSVTGYLLSQAQLLQGLEAVGEFSYAAYRTYQVPVHRIEDLTGLSFGPLTGADPLDSLEALTGEREINSHAELVL